VRPGACEDFRQAEQINILGGHAKTLGNTGVTKNCVVERGALPRVEALEDRIRVSNQAAQHAGCGGLWQVIRVMSLTENPRVGGSIPPLGTISLIGHA
jgi:hypothetical protein